MNPFRTIQKSFSLIPNNISKEEESKFSRQSTTRNKIKLKTLIMIILSENFMKNEDHIIRK